MNEIMEDAFFDELASMAKEAGVVPFLAGIGQAAASGGSALLRAGRSVAGGGVGVGHALKRVGQATQAGFRRGMSPLGTGVAGPLTPAQLAAQRKGALVGAGVLGAGALGTSALLGGRRQ
jgi:hypothetical protein